MDCSQAVAKNMSVGVEDRLLRHGGGIIKVPLRSGIDWLLGAD